MAKRGRNTEYIKARNRRLGARLYFYEELCGLRSEVFLPYLSEEFDLSQSRIEDLLTTVYPTATALKRKGVGIAELRQSYPFMNWRYEHSRRSETTALPLSDLA